MAEITAGERVGESRLLNHELSSLGFCSIFSSHLDEFFMVRVAGLRGREDAGVGMPSPTGAPRRRPLPRSASGCSS